MFLKFNRKEDTMKKDTLKRAERRKEAPPKDIMMKITKDTSTRKDTRVIIAIMRRAARRVARRVEVNMDISELFNMICQFFK